MFSNCVLMTLTLTFPAPSISKSSIKIKINVNFYFHTLFVMAQKVSSRPLKHRKLNKKFNENENLI